MRDDEHPLASIGISHFGNSVRTAFYADGMIEQELDLAGQITRRTMNISEKQIREALIRLGWTPPPEGFVPGSGPDIPTEAVPGPGDTSETARGGPPVGCRVRGPWAGSLQCGSRACTYPFCEKVGG